MTAVRDRDVRLLAPIAGVLRPEYEDPDAESAWEGSPFAWIRTRPSRQVGKIGEQLVAGWAAAKSLNVERSPDTEADRLIERRRVEIKFSTLWASGRFVFQQIRDQDYTHVVLLGIMPFDARCWVVPKGVAMREATPQHTGRRGRETYWLSIDVKKPAAWLKAYGGRLRQALAVMKRWTRRRKRGGR